LSASYSDPENVRGILTGDRYGRDLAMAVYAVPPLPLVTSIQVSNVVKSGTNIVITWGSIPGVPYSLLRTNNVKAPTTNWPVIVTGYIGSGSSLSYTDTTALLGTTNLNFYRIRNP
jgi:hypothetical protein